MKIEQKKNKKRPLYATGTALLASTMILSGCSLTTPTTTTTSELQLEGEPTTCEDYGQPVVNGYTYDIIGNPAKLSSQEYEPNFDLGWYIRDVEGEKFILISYGMTDNTKQHIEIENIGYDRDDDAVVIYLDLRTYRDFPLNDVTYPSCAVKFDKIPDKVKIRSYDGNTYLFGGYISDTDAWGLDVAIDPDYTAVFQSGHKSTYVYEIEDGKYRYIQVNSSRASHQHPNQRDFVKGSGTVDSIAALKSVCTRFGTFDEVMVKGDEENRIKAEDYIKMLTGDDV